MPRICLVWELAPREAAASDETRRELTALLDDFEWTSRQHLGELTMYVSRLRGELGLDQ